MPIILASDAGAALDTDLLNGGGTDDAAVLQGVSRVGAEPAHHSGRRATRQPVRISLHRPDPSAVDDSEL
jgi:hypothetical protein